MIRIGNFFFTHRNWVFPLVIALVFVDQPPALANEGLAVTIGFALAILGQSIRAITIGLAYIKRGGKNKKVYAKTLVQDGVFAHCRNPLYVGNFLMLLGLGFIANSLWFLAIGMPFFIFAYAAIIAAEESFLRKTFGGEFDDYCRRVPRLIPNLRGFGSTWRAMQFHWRRLIVKEHNSTFLWLVIAVVVLMQDRWDYTHDWTEPGMYAFVGALVVLVLCYLTVRVLKKSRTLVAD